MRGCVAPQPGRIHLRPLLVIDDGGDLLHQPGARAQIGGLLGRIGKRVPHARVSLRLGFAHDRPFVNSLNRSAARSMSRLGRGLRLLLECVRHINRFGQTRRGHHTERPRLIPHPDFLHALADGGHGLESIRLLAALYPIPSPALQRIACILPRVLGEFAQALQRITKERDLLPIVCRPIGCRQRKWRNEKNHSSLQVRRNNQALA